MKYSQNEIKNIKSKIKSGVLDFLDEIESYAKRNNLIIPEEEFVKYYPSRPNSVNIRIPVPSRHSTLLMHEMDKGASFTDGNLADVAEWLFEKDLGYPLTRLGDDPDNKYIERYEYDLIEFALEVLNYQVGLDMPESEPPAGYDVTFDEILCVSDEAFEKAFSTEIKPKYEAKQKVEYIIPLNSFAYTKRDVLFEFEKTTYEIGSYEIELASDVKLRELSDAEKAGLRTQYRRRPTDFPGPDAPTNPGYKYCLHIETEIEDRSSSVTHLPKPNVHIMNLMSDLTDVVTTCLRLFHPEMEVYKGNIYELENNWHSETLEIAKIGTMMQNRPQAVAGPWWRYRIGIYELTALNTFWEKYHPVIQNSMDQLSSPIRRFNQSYKKNAHEDRVLDYFIGLESSLLRGTSANYTFRLPARAAILLSEKSYYTNRYIYQFFDMVREIRNQIVHDDVDIREWINSVSRSDDRYPINVTPDLHPRDLVCRLRYFLAKVLLRYIDIHESRGLGVQEINNSMLEPRTRELLMNMD